MKKLVRRILVTNDDGIAAPGLRVATKIAQALSDDVWVFAPQDEQSGASHSLSLSRPVRVDKRGTRRYAVYGTPTDCVMIATRAILKDDLPDLVISGVNAGQNIAEDVSYSGTVSGAKEGTVFGIPSIALSQTRGVFGGRKPNFKIAEKYGEQVIRKLLKIKWGEGVLMNVNFPDSDPQKKCNIRITQQGKRDKNILALEERISPLDMRYFWYNFERHISNAAPDTDLAAIMNGDISITALKMNQSTKELTSTLRALFK